MSRLALALKAEAVLGVLLAVRHRTVRLAGFLALVVVPLSAMTGGSASSRQQLVLIIGGSLAAVAASRLLAPGAAVTAARRAASAWWIAPVGRLAGVWLLIVPIIGLTAAILADGPVQAARVVVAASLFSAAVGAVTLALAPLLGASGSGALGLLAVWFGTIPPSGMLQMLSGWPYVQRPVVLLWNVLPLDWRALRWMRVGGVEDPFVFVTSIAAGLALAAWAVAGPPAPGRHGAEARP
jgi:hypothetical protein